MHGRRMLMALLGGVIGISFAAAAQAAEIKPGRVAGELTKIDGKALTITADGKETVITCNDATKIRMDGASGEVALGDLKAGQAVRAYYNTVDSVALAVMVGAPSGAVKPVAAPASRVGGSLTKLDGKVLTIQTDEGETVITCDDKTSFSREGDEPGTKLSIADLEVGQKVRAYCGEDKVARGVIIAKPSEAKPPADKP